MPPEKLEKENNFIHSKTEIYCLGLVFSEVILEKRRFLISEEFWEELKEECLKQFNEKGEVIFTMIEKMLQYKICQRWTTRECLTHMNITEKVDETDSEPTTESNERKDQTSEDLSESEFSPKLSGSTKPKQKRQQASSSTENSCCNCTAKCVRNCEQNGKACTTCPERCTNIDNPKKRKNEAVHKK